MLNLKDIEMKLTSKFGKRLKEIRKMRNLSQQQLAELVGMESLNNISKLENGEQLPKKENLEKLCKVLQIAPKDLFDFGHFKSKEELISDIVLMLEKSSVKDLQFFYKVINGYFEAK